MLLWRDITERFSAVKEDQNDKKGRVLSVVIGASMFAMLLKLDVAVESR